MSSVSVHVLRSLLQECYPKDPIAGQDFQLKDSSGKVICQGLKVHLIRGLHVFDVELIHDIRSLVAMTVKKTEGNTGLQHN